MLADDTSILPFLIPLSCSSSHPMGAFTLTLHTRPSLTRTNQQHSTGCGELLVPLEELLEFRADGT